jgi:hypothetical protein
MEPLDKKEHCEASYTTQERGGSYIFGWITEESSGKADAVMEVQEGSNLCANPGPIYLDGADSFGIGSGSEDDALNSVYSVEEDGDLVIDVEQGDALLVLPPAIT